MALSHYLLPSCASGREILKQGKHFAAPSVSYSKMAVKITINNNNNSFSINASDHQGHFVMEKLKLPILLPNPKTQLSPLFLLLHPSPCCFHHIQISFIQIYTFLQQVMLNR